MGGCGCGLPPPPLSWRPRAGRWGGGGGGGAAVPAPAKKRRSSSAPSPVTPRSLLEVWGVTDAVVAPPRRDPVPDKEAPTAAVGVGAVVPAPAKKRRCEELRPLPSPRSPLLQTLQFRGREQGAGWSDREASLQRPWPLLSWERTEMKQLSSLASLAECEW